MKDALDEKSEVILAHKSYLSRISNEKIPCYEPSVGKEELELLKDVINSNWLSENKYTREFENQLLKICDRKYAVSFCNATSALISGMKSCGMREGDEIIVPSLSHSADPNSISVVGAIPVFADIEENTLCMSVKTIDAVKTNRTRAILFVSAYGNVSELDGIENYAKENNFILINDCAPALFGTYKGKPIASYGDFSVLSFFSDKIITTGEGRMLLSNNPDIIKECNMYKHDGRKERGVDLIERKGYNFRITELQTAIGVAQLKKANYFVKRKKEILKSYTSRLSNIPNVKVFQFSSKGDIVPHRIILLVPDAKSLISYLSPLGIGVRGMFMPMHSQPIYDIKKEFPYTEKIFKIGVCLPSAPTLTQKNIEFVCDSIKIFYKGVIK